MDTYNAIPYEEKLNRIIELYQNGMGLDFFNKSLPETGEVDDSNVKLLSNGDYTFGDYGTIVRGKTEFDNSNGNLIIHWSINLKRDYYLEEKRVIKFKETEAPPPMIETRFTSETKSKHRDDYYNPLIWLIPHEDPAWFNASHVNDKPTNKFMHHESARHFIFCHIYEHYNETKFTAFDTQTYVNKVNKLKHEELPVFEKHLRKACYEWIKEIAKTFDPPIEVSGDKDMASGYEVSIPSMKDRKRKDYDKLGDIVKICKELTKKMKEYLRKNFHPSGIKYITIDDIKRLKWSWEESGGNLDLIVSWYQYK